MNPVILGSFSIFFNIWNMWNIYEYLKIYLIKHELKIIILYSIFINKINNLKNFQTINSLLQIYFSYLTLISNLLC